MTDSNYNQNSDGQYLRMQTKNKFSSDIRKISNIKNDIKNDYFISKFNSFELLVHSTINFGWDFDSLSSNDSITENFILYYDTMFWNFSKLSEKKNLTQKLILNFKNTFLNYIEKILIHPCITIDFLINELQVPLSKNVFSLISKNSKLTTKDMEKYGEYIDYEQLSSNIYLDKNIFLIYSFNNWNMDKVSANPSLVSTLVLERTITKNWNLEILYGNPSFNPELITKDKRWQKFTKESMNNLSANPRLTSKFMKNNPKFPWMIKSLSKNPNIDLSIIKSNYELFWDWDALSENPAVTTKFIKECFKFEWDNAYRIKNNSTNEIVKENFPNLHFSWNWDKISKKQNLTEEFITDFKDKINFRELSKNPCITLKILSNNLNLPWDSNEYALNIGIHIEIMRDMLKVINLENLSKNRGLSPLLVLDNININWNFKNLSKNDMVFGMLKETQQNSFEKFLKTLPLTTIPEIEQLEKQLEFDKLKNLQLYIPLENTNSLTYDPRELFRD